MTATEGLFQQEGYDFMAAAFDVYNEMGNGFLEEVYQESVELELGQRGIAFLQTTGAQEILRGGFDRGRRNRRGAQSRQVPDDRARGPVDQLPQGNGQTCRLSRQFWFVSSLGMETVCSLN